MVQLDEVVGLQEHVVELDEGQLLVTVETHPDGIHRQHAVHGKMPADITQKLDVVQPGEPLGIVAHQRVVPSLAEAQEAVEHLADARLVVVDLLDREDLAGFVPAGRVADPRGAPAHQHDRASGARPLQPVQHHDRNEAADMERGRRAVVAHIGREPSLPGRGVDAGKVGGLVDEAALGERAEEIGGGG